MATATFTQMTTSQEMFYWVGKLFRYFRWVWRSNQVRHDNFFWWVVGGSNNAGNIGSNLIWGGIIAFGGFWIIDMAHAPTAAQDFNNEHGLKPVVLFENDHPILAMACKF